MSRGSPSLALAIRPWLVTLGLSGPPLRVSFEVGEGADVHQLPALLDTADEVRAIAKSERASEPVLRQAPLDHYRVVELATHGLLSGELKGLTEPALVLEMFDPRF